MKFYQDDKGYIYNKSTKEKLTLEEVNTYIDYLLYNLNIKEFNYSKFKKALLYRFCFRRHFCYETKMEKRCALPKADAPSQHRNHIS